MPAWPAADRVRASTCQHTAEDSAADGNLRLLSCERTSLQASSDLPLVSPHGGFDQRTLVIRRAV
jgi:hypothetical protein